MSDYFYNEKLLSTEDLESIYKVINNEECSWDDGLKTVTGNASKKEYTVKNNLELNIPYYLMSEISDILFSKIDSSIEFFYFALAKSSGSPIISRKSTKS